MKSTIPTFVAMQLVASTLVLTACLGSGGDDEGGASAPKALGEGPCSEPEQCAGEVCVGLIDGVNPPSYCTQSCGTCPSGFFCDSETFALVGLSFCRFGDPASNPPPPSEPPRLPCSSDQDCEAGAVCATFDGKQDCTVPCADESQCEIELQGVTFDFHTCAADQAAGSNRNVCLPDPSCFPNLAGCISFVQ